MLLYRIYPIGYRSEPGFFFWYQFAYDHPHRSNIYHHANADPIAYLADGISHSYHHAHPNPVGYPHDFAHPDRDHDSYTDRHRHADGYALRHAEFHTQPDPVGNPDNHPAAFTYIYLSGPLQLYRHGD